MRTEIPFAIKLADGRKYEVSDEFKIALGRQIVMVVGADGSPHLVPIRAITEISHLCSKEII